METRDADWWYKAGNARITEEKYEEAITSYDEAINLNPNYISAWNNKGIALFRLGRYEDAIGCYDKALEINPNHANAWYNKAKALRGLAQSVLETANKDRTTAAKVINNSLALFQSAEECYSKGELLSSAQN